MKDNFLFKGFCFLFFFLAINETNGISGRLNINFTFKIMQRVILGKFKAFSPNLQSIGPPIDSSSVKGKIALSVTRKI